MYGGKMFAYPSRPKIKASHLLNCHRIRRKLKERSPDPSHTQGSERMPLLKNVNKAFIDMSIFTDLACIMTANTDLVLPSGPSELCFERNYFLRKTFSADQFLHDHRNVGSLEKMRDDLGLFLRVLSSSMIELINEDYADFVNLSSNLVGLDQSIQSIQANLEQIRSGIDSVKFMLEENIKEVLDCLEQKDRLAGEKKILKSLAYARESVQKLENLENCLFVDDEPNPAILERASLEIIQLIFNEKCCKDLLSATYREKINQICRRVLEKINEYFLTALKTENTESVERCLRIYATLDEYSSAENVFKSRLVAPYMLNVIGEKFLQRSAQGLSGIYNQILDFVSLKMKILLLLTHHTGKVKGFDFLINSYWAEVAHQIETNMCSIFAPGNPDAFFKKYKCTAEFINQLERIIHKEDSLHKFRTNEQTKRFRSKWNLPVYFQIRFQEIASSVEEVCSSPVEEHILVTSNELKILPIAVAISAIKKLWSDKIYVEALFLKFWKLSLQLVARIITWLKTTCEHFTHDLNFLQDCRLRFLITLHTECVKFLKEIDLAVEKAVKLAPSKLEKCHDKLIQGILGSKESLMMQTDNILLLVCKEIVNKSLLNAKQVKDIPRLYRKTNREVPTKHCSYIEAMIDPLKSFQLEFSEQIDPLKLRSLFIQCLSKITEQYFNVVVEVLTSVQKTEESLRRLKNLREKTPSQASSSSNRTPITDDDKIRIQLQIDVTFWHHEITSLNISTSEVVGLSALTKAVGEATKIKIES